jgi:hypothetical protein
MAPKQQQVPDAPELIADSLSDSASVDVAISRDFSERGGLHLHRQYIKVPKALRVFILDEADESDPLNQLLVIGFRIRDEFAVKATFTGAKMQRQFLPTAVRALLLAAVENAAEIKDLLGK